MPNAAVDRVLYALHRAQVTLMMEPTGPGWIASFARELDAGLVQQLQELGAVVL